MSLFSGDSILGRFGNAAFDNSKLGQGYQLINSMVGPSNDKSYSGKLGLSDTMPKGNEENPEIKYPNGIFGESQSDKLPDITPNPYTPLIAPQMAQEDLKGF